MGSDALSQLISFLCWCRFRLQITGSGIVLCIVTVQDTAGSICTLLSYMKLNSLKGKGKQYTVN